MELIPAVILAGGAARRMGGGDKGLLQVGGRPILAHVIERLRSQTSALALSANGDPARFAAWGLPILSDGAFAGAGPLAGILAGMVWARGLASISNPPPLEGGARGGGDPAARIFVVDHARGGPPSSNPSRVGEGDLTWCNSNSAIVGATEALLSVPSDTPFLPLDFVQRLVAARHETGARIALAGSGGRTHFAAALWSLGLADDLERALAQGVRKVEQFTELYRPTIVDFPTDPFDPFFNINRPEDLKEAEGMTETFHPPRPVS